MDGSTGNPPPENDIRLGRVATDRWTAKKAVTITNRHWLQSIFIISRRV